MMKAITFPVIITAVNADQVSFYAESSPLQCEKCAEGKGCGAYPWFQGFLFRGNKTFSLAAKQAKDIHSLAVNDMALLSIDGSIMNRLSIIPYGFALVGFFLGLGLNFWEVSELWQASAAFAGAIIGILLSNPLAEYYLSQHLHLEKYHTHEGVAMCNNDKNIKP